MATALAEMLAEVVSGPTRNNPKLSSFLDTEAPNVDGIITDLDSWLRNSFTDDPGERKVLELFLRDPESSQAIRKQSELNLFTSIPIITKGLYPQIAVFDFTPPSWRFLTDNEDLVYKSIGLLANEIPVWLGASKSNLPNFSSRSDPEFGQIVFNYAYFGSKVPSLILQTGFDSINSHNGRLESGVYVYPDDGIAVPNKNYAQRFNLVDIEGNPIVTSHRMLVPDRLAAIVLLGGAIGLDRKYELSVSEWDKTLRNIIQEGIWSHGYCIYRI